MIIISYIHISAYFPIGCQYFSKTWWLSIQYCDNIVKFRYRLVSYNVVNMADVWPWKRSIHPTNIVRLLPARQQALFALRKRTRRQRNMTYEER